MKRGLAAAVMAGASLVAYERLVKPWQQRWGATDEELTMPLPGDERVAEPATQVTRAITIDAAGQRVWPWIVQLGADRGGFYSYDWLENLFGLGIESAHNIVEAWQDLGVGDVVYANWARSGGWYVVVLRPNEALVLKVADLATGRPVCRDEQTSPTAGRPAGGRCLPEQGQLNEPRQPFGHQMRRLLLRPPPVNRPMAAPRTTPARRQAMVANTAALPPTTNPKVRAGPSNSGPTRSRRVCGSRSARSCNVSAADWPWCPWR